MSNRVLGASWLLGLVLIGAGLGAASYRAALASGPDGCPEPNDALQAACPLPSQGASSFIANANDVDSFSIAALDFKAHAHAELPQAPASYRLSLWDRNAAEPLAVSTVDRASLDRDLDLPGVYYLQVDSWDGEYSETAPYAVSLRLSYADTAIPQTLRTTYFDGRGGSTSDLADVVEEGGRLTIKMKRGGSSNNGPEVVTPSQSQQLDDFMLTVDTRLVRPVVAAYRIGFRAVDTDNFYVLTVDTSARRARVDKTIGGVSLGLTEWVAAPSVDSSGGVNRTTIRCVGSICQVFINGVDVIGVENDELRAGRYFFGATAWGDPPEVRFDNLVISTPTTSVPPSPPGGFYLDLGNPGSEQAYQRVGWADRPAFAGWNPFESPSHDRTKRYQLYQGDSSIVFQPVVPGEGYRLTAEVEDGSCPDNFDLLANGRQIYSFTGLGQLSARGDPAIRSHPVEIPAALLTGTELHITFRNTATRSCGLAGVYNIKLEPSN